MSKFTEEWQRVRQELGHMVGVMESMAGKYGECSNLEETFYNKGLVKGREEGLRQTKAEICKDCIHKSTAENCCEYANMINMYAKLSSANRDIVLNMIYALRRDK